MTIKLTEQERKKASSSILVIKNYLTSVGRSPADVNFYNFDLLDRFFKLTFLKNSQKDAEELQQSRVLMNWLIDTVRKASSKKPITPTVNKAVLEIHNFQQILDYAVREHQYG